MDKLDGERAVRVIAMKVQGNIAEAFRAAEPFEPAYLKTFESGELARKVEEAIVSLEKCWVCPWHCEIDRLADQTKVCRTGRYARVGSYFAHFGEEDCLRGWNGTRPATAPGRTPARPG